MGRYYNGTAGLPQAYKVSAKQPIDIREIVETFNDLLDNKITFYNSAYKGMRVLVLDECCVYEMVADAFSKSPSDWKRLTIETINANNDNDEAGALTRAKTNLVNGALIYIANDIVDGETTTKKGLYWCQNVDGVGKLTLAGGGEIENGSITKDKLNGEVQTSLGKADSAIQEAELSNAITSVVNALNAAISQGDENTLSAVNTTLENYSTTETMNAAIAKAIYDSIDVVLDQEY